MHAGQRIYIYGGSMGQRQAVDLKNIFAEHAEKNYGIQHKINA